MTDDGERSDLPKPGSGQRGTGTQTPATDELRSVRTSLISRIFLVQVIIILVVLVFVGIGIVYPQRLAALPISFLCGMMGGSLSLLKRIRAEELNVLKEVDSSRFTALMPILYGGILASIGYLFFLGCILTGDGEGGLFTSNLFPKFDNLECLGAGTPDDVPLDMSTLIKTKPQTTQDFAKILIWSILAGYSEKFVVGILTSLQRRGQS